MKRRKHPLVQRAEYAVVQGIGAALRLAPPASLDRWSRGIASAAPRLFRGRTEMAVANVRRVFPDKSDVEARVLVRRCWEHFARTTLEFLRTIDEPLERIAERFDIHGWENAEKALSRQRGAVIVTAHLGSWEFGISMVTLIEGKVTIVARPLDNELLHEKILGARRRLDVEFVDRRNAARSLVRTLEEKGSVIVVADQAVRPREGILVPFLGRPAWTTSSPARLSLRFGAPIVCLFVLPTGQRFDLIIEPPIVPEDFPESERTPEALTARINDVMSARILQTPELWLWMHNRWKNA